MKIKNFLGLVLSVCLFVMTNGNANKMYNRDATVMLNLRPDKFDVMLDGELKTVDYSLESINKINDFIGKYFKIDSICYNNDRTVAIIDCLQVENNIPCNLTMRNAFKSEEPHPKLRFIGGKNNFYGIKGLGFRYGDFTI